MSMRPHKLCAVLMVTAVLWAACGEEELGNNGIIVAPPRDVGAADAGDSVGGADAEADSDLPDPRCAGRAPGATCEMPNASGVCALGRCQLLSCKSGYRDCDEAASTGCETDVTVEASCGVCGVSCTGAESCQLSRAGWVCSIAPVCTDGTYDLDGDPENRCEWRSRWGADGVFDPPTLRPDIAVNLSSGAFAVAGNTGDVRMVTTTEASAAAEGLALPVDAGEPVQARDAVELEAEVGPSQLAVAWSDAVTLSSTHGSDADDGVFEYVCEAGARSVARAFTAVAGAGDSAVYATTTGEVLQLERDCPPGNQLCEQPSSSFTQADYLAEYFPSVDQTACGGCEPAAGSCPVFEPVDAQYLEDSGRLVVFTKRGFVIIEPTASGFVAGARQELGPGAQPGVYVAGVASEQAGATRISMLTNTGMLRRFVVEGSEVRPGGPDIGVAVDSDGPLQLVSGPDESLVVADRRLAWLVQPMEQSARIEALSEPEVFLGNGQIIFGAGYSPSPSDMFSLFYYGVGRYYLRQVSR